MKKTQRTLATGDEIRGEVGKLGKEGLAILASHALLLLRARGRSGDEVDLTPEDAVQEAVKGLLEGRRAWDRSKQPNLVTHLKLIIRSVISHHYEKAGPKVVNVAALEEFEALRQGFDGEEGEETILGAIIAEDDAADQQYFLDSLSEAIADDGTLSKILDLIREGLDDGEIANELGFNVDEMYNAKRRLIRMARSAARSFIDQRHGTTR